MRQSVKITTAGAEVGRIMVAIVETIPVSPVSGTRTKKSLNVGRFDLPNDTGAKAKEVEVEASPSGSLAGELFRGSFLM